MTTTRAGVVLRHIRGLARPAEDDRLLLERFTLRRDEPAFAELVRRHGPMVHGVCRRVLRDPHAADDAFQATFLVLARKAGAIGRRDSVGGWLYRVAYNTALKAKAGAAARQRRERNAGQPVAADPLDEVTGRELLAVLDEELQKLPERLRVALVLCYLEGKARDEAAQQLGCPLGTLKRRLSEGRERLRARLERRGLALPAALLAAGVTASAVPPALAAAAARVATGSAAPQVVLLAGAVVRGRLKTFAAVLLAVGLVVGVGLLAARPPAAEEANPPAAAPKEKEPAPPAPDEKSEMTVSGRVLGADGRPVAGASVAVVARPRRHDRSGDPAADRTTLLGKGKTDADGCFRLTAARTSSARFWEVYAVAASKGHALGWQRLGPDAARPEATLKLPPETVVRARLADLQGLPAAGVKVSVSWVGQEVNGQSDGVNLTVLPPRLGLWPEPVMTDEKGDFTIRSCNRDRGIHLTAGDDRFAAQSFEITPVGKPRTERRTLALDGAGYLEEHKRGPDEKGQPEVPTFTLVPAQVLEGRVVCEDTGKPAVKARVNGTETDAEGHFRLTSAGRKGVTLEVVASEGESYLSVFHRVEWPKGTVKQEVVVKLPRGVLLRGRVTEAGSGQPVAAACVQFWPRQIDNPNLRKNVVHGWQKRELTQDDGTFRIAVPPGPGHLLIQGPTPDYVHDEKITSEVVYSGRSGGNRLYPDAAVKIDVPAKGDLKDVAVTLRRGATVRCRLVGPDGKPVARAVVLDRLHVFHDLSWHFACEARDGLYEVHGLDPDKSVPVIFLDAVNQCGAVAEIAGKQAGEEVTVKLAPCGKATARYLDGKGTPIAGFRSSPDVVVTPGHSGEYQRDDAKEGELRADEGSLVNFDRHNYWDKAGTDAEGRVTFPALVPGVTYRVGRWEKDRWVLHKEFKVESGKTIDLGDVRIDKGE